MDELFEDESNRYMKLVRKFEMPKEKNLESNMFTIFTMRTPHINFIFGWFHDMSE